MPERVLVPPSPLSLSLTLGHLARGPYDPTFRWVSADEAWRATRTPDGPAAVAIRAEGGRVRARAWGPGARWVLETLPDLLGFSDDPSPLAPRHPLLRDLQRRFRGLRIGRTGLVMEALVPSIIEQKVTSNEAHRSYARLVRRYGERAPGPLALFVPPAPERMAALPYWTLHPLGIERRRADALLRACATSRRLEEAAAMTAADAQRRLRAIPGIGAWTGAEVARVAFGDPDAVSVGDYHLKNVVAWALAGEPRATDDRMLELLEPYRGQRGRVVRLLEAAGVRAPRFGPRARLRAIERV